MAFMLDDVDRRDGKGKKKAGVQGSPSLNPPHDDMKHGIDEGGLPYIMQVYDSSPPHCNHIQNRKSSITSA